MTEPQPGFIPALPIFERGDHDLVDGDWPTDLVGERPPVEQPDAPPAAPPPQYDPMPGHSELALDPNYIDGVLAVQRELDEHAAGMRETNEREAPEQ